ncbi:dihydrolipoamide dehydrogenase domain protein [Burkholderia pseudomallei]|nr:dihydrolipoamide dehydrogenase domain protein [Burkholderia pseudomallei]
MSVCSFSITSPGLTLTSMTSTPLKSPISGTLTSMRLITVPFLIGCRQRGRSPQRKTRDYGLTKAREPGQYHLCRPPKDAPFFWLLFFGRRPEGSPCGTKKSDRRPAQGRR